MNEKEISEPKKCALKEMAIPLNVNYNAYDWEKVREILGFKNKLIIEYPSAERQAGILLQKNINK